METSKIRRPAFAGQFYPALGAALKQQIEGFIDKKAERMDVIGCLLPHAGYIYSGKVAAETISRVNIRDTVILLGPNHTGFGAPFSLMSQGLWQTPLGEIQIDASLAKKILDNSEYLEDDCLAHTDEHSLEVELPILQCFKTNFKIVPIAFLSDDTKALKKIGQDLANTIKESNLSGSTMFIASSDMTHYEPQISAEQKDKEAIEAILELNEDKLMDKIKGLGISMCGYAPVVVMLKAAKILGATSAALIKYQTSAEVTKDKTSVVGYAGITIY